MTQETSRRVVLGGAAVIGAGAVLSACGGTDTSPPDSEAPATSGASPASGGGDNGAGVAKAADVPVGSGIIVASAKAVVTQPKAGEFKAFSYICSHKGCPVSKVVGDTISCPCHGSQYSTADGSVKRGPATAPLAPLSIKEDGGELFVS
ncbi:MAG: Rieske (2Fe-2S) protein [Aeromicrobium sp.]